jgi:hypothetical protein
MSPTVAPDLRVLAFRQDALDLLIDVYGGPANACTSVRLIHTAPADLRANLRIVRRWRDKGVPVTLILDETDAALVEVPDAR